MQKFEEKKFTIPELTGISAASVAEHLKLYAGYVKNANLIYDKCASYGQDVEGNTYVLDELMRRLSFEYNGIRNHEVYFASLEGGASTLADGSALKQAIANEWGSFDVWLEAFKHLAATVRGIGWAVLWYDPRSKKLLSSWVDEQHLGILQGCTMILGLDMWEHSYVADYQPSGKKQYIEDYFKNVNWSVGEKNFLEATK